MHEERSVLLSVFIRGWQLLLRSSTGERLGHVDLAIARHRIAEVLAVADLTAVHEDHHVRADGPLLIEHVRPRAWVTAEDCVQRLANRVTFNASGRAGDVALDVRREGDRRHVCHTDELKLVVTLSEAMGP